MNFDTEFDYGNVILTINGYITSYENTKSESIMELNVLGNLSEEYNAVSNKMVQYHTTKINCLNTSISRLSNILNEINVVQNLPSDSKNVLYEFYETYVKNNETCIGIDTEKNRKIHYMRQMVCNTNEMIPHVSNLMSNMNMTTEECCCVASLICKHYSPDRQTMLLNSVLNQTLP